MGTFDCRTAGSVAALAQWEIVTVLALFVEFGVALGRDVR